MLVIDDEIIEYDLSIQSYEYITQYSHMYIYNDKANENIKTRNNIKLEIIINFLYVALLNT